MHPSFRELSLLLGGFGAGAILSSGVNNRWGEDIAVLATSSNFATLMAGILGAVIGGLISYFIARQTARETKERDDKSRLSAERTNAFACMVTTMQIANGLFTMKKYLDEATSPSLGVQPWQKLQANAGSKTELAKYDPIGFTPFINAGHAGIVHRALLLAERYHSTLAGFEQYNEKRINLEEFLVPMSTFKSGAMTSAIPPKHHTAAAYRMETLNKLILQLSEFCNRDFADAKVILADMQEAFSSYFGKSANFKIEFTEE